MKKFWLVLIPFLLVSCENKNSDEVYNRHPITSEEIDESELAPKVPTEISLFLETIFSNPNCQGIIFNQDGRIAFVPFPFEFEIYPTTNIDKNIYWYLEIINRNYKDPTWIFKNPTFVRIQVTSEKFLMKIIENK